MLIHTFLNAVLALSISGVSPRITALLGRISVGSTPVAGAIVTITSPAFVKSTMTDGTGRFLFEGIPSGRYDFRTSAQGYAVFECPVVVHGVDSNRNRINITALLPVDQQTVSAMQLLRRQPSPITPKRDGAATENRQQSLR